MLQLVVPKSECYNENTQEFIAIDECTLQLEHSLISLSKWESKWEKPFLVKEPPKTSEEILDYIRCMTITQNVKPEVYLSLTEDNLNSVNSYIEAPMTATWFKDDRNRPSREIITSEIIYYWMIAYNIPSEYQKWHLNRLLTLIKVCSVKNSPQKKMSRREIMAQNRILNEERKKKLNSHG